MRLYFHLKDATDTVHDLKGVEVSNVEEARAQTIQAIRELCDDDASSARDWSGWRLEIADADGVVLFSLDLDPDTL